MTEPAQTNREQSRREAERFIDEHNFDPIIGGDIASTFAARCLTLLAELEQAEKERDEMREAAPNADVAYWQDRALDHATALTNARQITAHLEHRLTKAAALAEALKTARTNLAHVLDTSDPMSGFDSLSLVTAAHASLTDALTAWETE